MTPATWSKQLESCPTIKLKVDLWRHVDKAVYESGKPPAYLYTSGSRNRYNPEGVQCIYMSEDDITAKVEFHQLEKKEIAAGGITTLKEYLQTLKTPIVTYSAGVEVRHVIDLCDAQTVKHFGFTKQDLFGSWILKAHTPANHLGAAISRQTKVAGIRYPSAALAKIQSWGIEVPGQYQDGANVVIFKQSLVKPGRLVINDVHGMLLEEWPS